jgi:DNA-binding MarR family transcriptional regulator
MSSTPAESALDPTVDPSARADVDRFLTSFDTLAQAVRRARGARAVDSGGMTLSQYGLLEPLLDGEPARVRDLATQAGVTAPTATRILDTLERSGIVRRSPAVDDRRGVSVRLTADGRRLLDAQHEWLRSRQRAFHAALEPDERAIAPGLMVQVATLIDELAGGPAGLDDGE